MPFAFLELSRWPIRWKLAAILSVVVVLNIVTDLLVQKLVILPSFERLEQDEAREAADRCVKAISQEAKHLRLFAEDWSSWDDTYQFAVDGSAAYIASNLTAAMFRSAQLNLVCVFNARGEVVWGGVRHEGSDGAITKDAVLERELAETPAIIRQDSSLSVVSGIFLSRHGPLVIASMPILASDGHGPSRGAFVMGRVLDESMITSLGDQSGVTLHVWPIRRGALPRDKVAVLERITPASPSVVRVESDNSIGVFTVYRDVAREPGLLLESVIERDITPKGKLAGKYALLSSAVSGLVILLALIFSLRNAVVAPIRNLTRRVMDFSAGDSRLHSSLDEHGDEVALLSKEFGEMKERLEADMEQRRLSEARMRAILVSAPDGILTVDQSGAIESLNPAGEAMFGYGAGELAGKNWRVLVSGEFRDADDRQVATAIRERAAAGSILGHEVAGVRKDGSVFPMHVTASEVQLGGRRVILGILRDITELTQMHERVLHAEHLATIGEMGASVAHEIKNPIAAIGGAIQVLRDSLDPEDERRGVMKEILEQVGRVDLTVRELLMFAKPWRPEKTLCELWPVVAAVVARAESDSTFRDVVFDVSGDPTVAAALDPFLFEQVIWNVFLNGAQAMHRGGRILCAIESLPESARVAITDTGSGLSAEAQDNVFRPFFTTKTRGTGLGLAVSRQIMEAHGGSIAIESTRGAGTRVTLTLPRTIKS